MSDDIAEDQIAAFVDRILRLKAEADDIAADIKEIYAEAHGNGFNKTRLGEIVTYLRKVEKDKDAVDEAEAVRDLYLAAYYRAKNKPHTHAYAREPKTAPASTTQTASVSEAFDPETGEEVTTQIQPETAKLLGTVASAMETEAGRAALTTALDIMIEREEINEPKAPTPLPVDQGQRAAVSIAQEQRPAEEKSLVEEAPEPGASGGVQDECAIHPATLYADPGIVIMETVPPVGIVAHPYAACWPVNIIDVTGGVREPIVKLGNLIVDGRGRYFAARAAMIEYPVVQYAGDDLLMDTIQWNLRSRTMAPQQRGNVMGKLQKLVPEREGEIEDLFLSLAAEERQAAE